MNLVRPLMSDPFHVPVGDGVELCAQSFGEEAAPTLLLLGGATASMDWWEVDWCVRLAAEGLRIVRFDHRDTGASTAWPAGAPGYSSRDLTRDPIRLLDALGVEDAHLLGVSMGGGIAQDLAVTLPGRVRSLTLVATTCAFGRGTTGPLPPPESRVAELFEHPPAEPDWSDSDAVVEHLVEGQRPYAGGLGVDEETVRAVARSVVGRTRDVRASLTNHWQVVGDGDEGPVHTMAEIAVPTLVVHGRDDPMFPLPHGVALANEIAGARLVVVPGMGHEVPPRPTWDQVLTEVVALVRSVERG